MSIIPKLKRGKENMGHIDYTSQHRKDMKFSHYWRKKSTPSGESTSSFNYNPGSAFSQKQAFFV
jgi:hypothetical protein